MSDDFVYRDEREELDLELEDIAPPPAQGAPEPTQPAPGEPAAGTAQARAARQAVALPHAAGHGAHRAPHAAPARTPELRLAEVVDALPHNTRLGLLGLVIVCMLLVATSGMMISWKRVVTQAIEDVQAEGGPIVVP